MRRRSRVTALLGTAMFTVGLLPGLAPPAASAPSTASATCSVDMGSVTAGGDIRSQYATATVPPTATSRGIVARDVYPDGQPRLSTSASLIDINGVATRVDARVVMGNALYDSTYTYTEDGSPVSNVKLTRVGGGWGSFTAIERSSYATPDGSFTRSNMYGLRGDGVLFRWTGTWGSRTSAPGFAAVKSMVLISETRTYDTFLANTRGGALYTIHLPTTSPMKPVVKLVRRSTWQVFEAMLAAKCGRYGTLLLGIDKDTKAAYLYAVGHASGLATVIQGRGKVPGAFADPVYFRWTFFGDQLFGE